MMKLTNPTDNELNRAFAEKVAGWTHITTNIAKQIVGRLPPSSLYNVLPNFTHSADAVLPWLEKQGSVNIDYPCWPDRSGRPDKSKTLWCVTITDSFGLEHKACDAEQPRAVVIAILRAHGVEVEFTETADT